MPEAALTTVRLAELLDNFEFHLLHWHKNHLRNALARLNLISFLATIPAGNIDLSLVIRIDQARPELGKQKFIKNAPRGRVFFGR